MLGTKTERVAALFHRYLESGQNWLTGGRQRLRPSSDAELFMSRT